MQMCGFLLSRTPFQTVGISPLTTLTYKNKNKKKTAGLGVGIRTLSLQEVPAAA
jgi:hypothetical protein